MKLDIGSGQFPRPGYTTVDLYHPAGIRASMDALPLDDGAVDEIASSHSLEHQPQARVLPTLREWLRVLRPGGTLDLKVPDLRFACRNWLEKQCLGLDMMFLFGTQEGPGEFHKSGFSPEILAAYLEEAGFEIESFAIVWDHAQDTIHAVARKPEG